MNYRMAKALVFTKVRTTLGLDNCHSFFSGAAPLSQEVLEFFLSLDIPIGEIYGMSESSGPHTASSKSKYRVLRYQAAAAPSPWCRGVRPLAETHPDLDILAVPFSSPPSLGPLAYPTTSQEGRLLESHLSCCVTFPGGDLNDCVFSPDRAPKIPENTSSQVEHTTLLGWRLSAFARGLLAYGMQARDQNNNNDKNEGGGMART